MPLQLPPFMIPPACMELKQSIVASETQGIFCKTPISSDTKFGPFVGEVIAGEDIDRKRDEIDFRYAWHVVNNKTGKILHVVNATTPEKGNWMRYVNCARFFEEQNIVSVQEGAEIYYKVLKDIKPGDELLTWFDPLDSKKKPRRRKHNNCSTSTYSVGMETSSPQTSSVADSKPMGNGKRLRKKKVSQDMLSLDDDDVIFASSGLHHNRIRTNVSSGLRRSSSLPDGRMMPNQKIEIHQNKTPSASYSGSKTVNSTSQQTNIPVTIEMEIRKAPCVQITQPIKPIPKGIKATKSIHQIIDSLKSAKEKSVDQEAKVNGSCNDMGDKTFSGLIVPTVVKQRRSSLVGTAEYIEEHLTTNYQFLFEVTAEHKTVPKNALKRIQYACDICEGQYRKPISLKRHYLREHINHKYLSKEDLSLLKDTLATLTDRIEADIDPDADDIDPSENSTDANDAIVKQEIMEREANLDLSGDITVKEEKGDEISAKKCKASSPDREEQEKSLKSKALEGKIPFSYSGTDGVDDAFRCYLCVQLFPSVEKLKYHTTHDSHRSKGDKQFACDRCGQRFRFHHNYQRHLESHGAIIGELLTACHICGKRFLNEANMRKHLRFHSGRNFPCKYGCDVVYPNVAELVKHLRAFHPELPKKSQIPSKGVDFTKKQRGRQKDNISVEPVSSTSQEYIVEQQFKTEAKPDFEVSHPPSWTETRGRKPRPGIVGVHCTICKKKFSTYGSMCRHRRSVHRNLKQTGEIEFVISRPNSKSTPSNPAEGETSVWEDPSTRRALHIEANVERMYQAIEAAQARKEAEEENLVFSPPLSPTSFYLNVSDNIAENLSYYLDGGSEALKMAQQHIIVDSYVPVDEAQGIHSSVDTDWSRYNFPPFFMPVDPVIPHPPSLPQDNSIGVSSIIEGKKTLPYPTRSAIAEREATRRVSTGAVEIQNSTFERITRRASLGSLDKRTKDGREKLLRRASFGSLETQNGATSEGSKVKFETSGLLPVQNSPPVVFSPTSAPSQTQDLEIVTSKEAQGSYSKDFEGQGEKDYDKTQQAMSPGKANHNREELDDVFDSTMADRMNDDKCALENEKICPSNDCINTHETAEEIKKESTEGTYRVINGKAVGSLGMSIATEKVVGEAEQLLTKEVSCNILYSLSPVCNENTSCKSVVDARKCEIVSDSDLTEIAKLECKNADSLQVDTLRDGDLPSETSDSIKSTFSEQFDLQISNNCPNTKCTATRTDSDISAIDDQVLHSDQPFGTSVPLSQPELESTYLSSQNSLFRNTETSVENTAGFSSGSSSFLNMCNQLQSEESKSSCPGQEQMPFTMHKPPAAEESAKGSVKEILKDEKIELKGMPANGDSDLEYNRSRAVLNRPSCEPLNILSDSEIKEMFQKPCTEKPFVDSGHHINGCTERPFIDSGGQSIKDCTERPFIDSGGHSIMDCTERPFIDSGGHSIMDCTEKPFIDSGGHSIMDCTERPFIDSGGHSIMDCTEKPFIDSGGHSIKDCTEKSFIDSGHPIKDYTERPFTDSGHSIKDCTERPFIDSGGHSLKNCTEKPFIDSGGHCIKDCTERPFTDSGGHPSKNSDLKLEHISPPIISKTTENLNFALITTSEKPTYNLSEKELEYLSKGIIYYVRGNQERCSHIANKSCVAARLLENEAEEKYLSSLELTVKKVKPNNTGQTIKEDDDKVVSASEHAKKHKVEELNQNQLEMLQENSCEKKNVNLSGTLLDNTDAKNTASEGNCPDQRSAEIQKAVPLVHETTSDDNGSSNHQSSKPHSPQTPIGNKPDSDSHHDQTSRNSADTGNDSDLDLEIVEMQAKMNLQILQERTAIDREAEEMCELCRPWSTECAEPSKRSAEDFLNMKFGRKYDVYSVCSMCRRYYHGLESLLRHQWKKHPSIQCSHIEVENGYGLEILFYPEPSCHGELAQSILLPIEHLSQESYTCTRCKLTVRQYSRLRAHILSCDPNTPTTPHTRKKKAKANRHRFMEKMLPEKSIKEERATEPERVVRNLSFKTKGVLSTGSRIKSLPSDSDCRPFSASPRKEFQYISHSQTSSPTSVPTRAKSRHWQFSQSHSAPTTPSKIRFSSEAVCGRGRKRRNYELLYNPAAHIRRRERTECVDIHQCQGCGLKFKTLSLLERHGKNCSGKDKLLSEKSVVNKLLDGSGSKKHSCHYCPKRFKYLKGVFNHYTNNFCRVRAERMSNEGLSIQDQSHEAELQATLQQQAWNKTENRDHTDVIQGRAHLHDDGTIVHTKRKGGWPKGLKRSNKRRRHGWTYIKRRKLEGSGSETGNSPGKSSKSPVDVNSAATSSCSATSAAMSELEARLREPVVAPAGTKKKRSDKDLLACSESISLSQKSKHAQHITPGEALSIKSKCRKSKNCKDDMMQAPVIDRMDPEPPAKRRDGKQMSPDLEPPVLTPIPPPDSLSQISTKSKKKKKRKSEDPAAGEKKLKKSDDVNSLLHTITSKSSAPVMPQMSPGDGIVTPIFYLEPVTDSSGVKGTQYKLVQLKIPTVFSSSKIPNHVSLLSTKPKEQNFTAQGPTESSTTGSISVPVPKPLPPNFLFDSPPEPAEREQDKTVGSAPADKSPEGRNQTKSRKGKPRKRILFKDVSASPTINTIFRNRKSPTHPGIDTIKNIDAFHFKTSTAASPVGTAISKPFTVCSGTARITSDTTKASVSSAASILPGNGLAVLPPGALFAVLPNTPIMLQVPPSSAKPSPSINTSLPVTATEGKFLLMDSRNLSSLLTSGSFPLTVSPVQGVPKVDIKSPLKAASTSLTMQTGSKSVPQANSFKTTDLPLKKIVKKDAQSLHKPIKPVLDVPNFLFDKFEPQAVDSGKMDTFLEEPKVDITVPPRTDYSNSDPNSCKDLAAAKAIVSKLKQNIKKKKKPKGRPLTSKSKSGYKIKSMVMMTSSGVNTKVSLNDPPTPTTGSAAKVSPTPCQTINDSTKDTFDKDNFVYRESTSELSLFQNTQTNYTDSEHRTTPDTEDNLHKKRENSVDVENGAKDWGSVVLKIPLVEKMTDNIRSSNSDVLSDDDLPLSAVAAKIKDK